MNKCKKHIYIRNNIVSLLPNLKFYTMKTVFLIVFTLIFVSGLSAQENTPQDQATKSKKEKKAEKEALQAKQFEETFALLNSKRFVLEADFLVTDYGDRISVTSNLNFIMVDSNMAVIQVGRNVGIGGNGVGGTTAKGTITSWQIDKNEKKKSFNIRMNINTTIGFYSVSMYIPTNNNTTARVTPNNINLDGKLVPLDKSIVHEGWSL
jgi:ATPase subunit of ABC transporter with duplicated ATPase domains